MSAEERAAEIVESVIASGDYERASGIIASAIREAEASARNEALEEAAVSAERVPPIPPPPGDIPERFAWRAAMQEECASAIRNLKTKD